MFPLWVESIVSEPAVAVSASWHHRVTFSTVRVPAPHAVPYAVVAAVLLVPGRSLTTRSVSVRRDALRSSPSITTLQKRKKLFRSKLAWLFSWSLGSMLSGNSQSQEIKGHDCMLAAAAPKHWAMVVAFSTSPSLGAENEGCEPEVGENDVQRRQMALIFADKWHD